MLFFIIFYLYFLSKTIGSLHSRWSFFSFFSFFSFSQGKHLNLPIKNFIFSSPCSNFPCFKFSLTYNLEFPLQLAEIMFSWHSSDQIFPWYIEHQAKRSGTAVRHWYRRVRWSHLDQIEAGMAQNMAPRAEKGYMRSQAAEQHRLVK